MTGQFARELIKQHHPVLPHAQLVSLINEAQRDFCNKTHIYKASLIDTSVAGQRYYTLPDAIIKILKVHVDDVEIPRLQGDPVIDDDELGATNPLATPTSTSNDRYWYESVGRIGIVENIGNSTNYIRRDDKSTPYQSISEALEIRIFAITSPSDFTVSTIEAGTILDGIQGGYERAIIDYVISQGYFLPNNLNPELAQLFDAKYQRTVRDARKIAKSRYIEIGRVIPNDF